MFKSKYSAAGSIKISIFDLISFLNENYLP